MSGAAVEKACRAVTQRVKQAVAERNGLAVDRVDVRDGRIVSSDGAIDVSIAEAVDGVVEETVRHMHRETFALDPVTGQGDADVSFIFVAHRAVVDVDPDLGLVRVVQITTGQDVGRALNPLSVIGQIEGGISQGVGLAVMEEIVTVDGVVQNPSFTDYLIPTFADVPKVEIALIEQPEPDGPFGAKGVGETPSLSSTPAVAAAIRAATGLDLPRVPVRPQDIALADR